MTDRYDIRLPRLPFDLRDKYYNTTCKVLDDSFIRYRKAVETFACYFKREMGYCFLQYSWEHPSGKGKHYSEAEAYLFFKNMVPVGAICFRRRRDEFYRPLFWYLDWVWIHPYVRGAGLLEKSWPRFREEYGDFLISTPISKPMQRFLEKVNHPINPIQKVP